jgi:hypothetical protein
MRSRATTLIAAWIAAIFVLAAQATPAHADPILNFGLDNPNSIVAVANAGTGVTTINNNGAQTATITFIEAALIVPITGVNFTLSATSSGPAVFNPIFDTDTQFFSGSFSLTKGTTNYLSGTFSDMSFVTGSNKGNSASLNSSDPPATITFTSSVIANTNPPSAATFSFSNVTPPLHIVGGPLHPTIGSFHATGSGTFSGSAVPEPSTLAVGGLGALGLIGYGLRRRKAAVV